MVVLDFTIVDIALPSIQRAFHIAPSTSQWLISAYAVAFGGFLLLGGRLADIAGQARLYRIGLVIVVAANISCGSALDPGLLIASRVAQGVGAALLVPATLSLVVTSWPDEEGRRRALGVYGAVASTGFAAGAVLGGALVDATWRLVFYANAANGVAVLIGSWRLLPPDRPARAGTTDVLGAVTVTAGVALVVLAVTRASDTLRLGQPALFATAGAVLLAAFVARERRTRSSLVDLALFEDRRVVGANLSFFALGAIIAGELLVVTLYLREGRGLSAFLAGLCLVPQALGAVALSGPPSKLVPRLGPRRAIVLAMALAVVGLVGAAVAVGSGSLPGLLASGFVLGLMGRLAQLAGTLAGTSGPVAVRAEGIASALLTTTRQCGCALGIAVMSTTLAAAQGTTARRAELSLFVAASFALAALLVTFVIPSGPTASPTARPEHRFSLHSGGVP
jgi:MFS family permease